MLCSNYPAVSKRPESPVVAGESLNLDCSPAETTPGSAKPQIHWLDQHGDIVEGSKATYTFTAAHQHNGQWTCVVTNDNTVSFGKISVSVAGEFQRGCAVFQESTLTLSFNSFSLIIFFGGNCKSLPTFPAVLFHILKFTFIKFYNHVAYSRCGIQKREEGNVAAVKLYHNRSPNGNVRLRKEHFWGSLTFWRSLGVAL